MRLHDWEPRLAALFEQRRRAPFVWGSNDCCLFAADAVLATCGYDPADGIRGTYNTEDEANAVILSHGGLDALAAARVGPAVPVELAAIGDVGIVMHGSREFFGVFGGRAWHTPATGAAGGGLVVFRSALRAWRADRG